MDEEDKLLGEVDDSIVDEEEEKRIEQLALNSNFDPALLDCWDEAVATAVTTSNSSAGNSLPDTSHSEHTKCSETPDRSGRAKRGSASHSPSLERADSTTAANEEDEAWDEFDKAHQSIMAAMARTPPPPPFTTNNSTNEHTDIPSLPPFETATHATNAALQQQNPGAPSMNGSFPTGLAPLAPSSASDLPENLPPFFPSGAMDGTSLLPLAINALAAGVDLSSFFSTNSLSNPMAGGPSTNVSSSVSGENEETEAPPTKKPPPSKKRGGGRRGKASSARNRQQQASSEEEEVPFMLFDAPVELRHNFIQSQRAHGLPILHDNNSYHYARSATAAETGNSSQPYSFANMPRMVDARHGDDTAGSKRIKNAKEQKRAQRITELIEQLRVRMEKGGWKVGIKSKLHTLSSCSDYVKHLVKATKEKEAAVEEARHSLENKRRKLEEEKSNQDPSEPESTTSSLTVSSGSRSANKRARDTSEGSNKCQNNNVEDNMDIDKEIPSNEADKDASGSADQCSEGSEGSPDKKCKISSQESKNSGEYPSSVDNDENEKRTSKNGVGRNVSIGPISSVSDITDNNKYAKGSSATSSSEKDSSTPKDMDAEPSAQNTVCSDAAVAETSDPRDHSHDSSTSRGDSEKRGVSIQTITTNTSNNRKRKAQELSPSSSSGKKSSRDSSSLARSFQLDYEEVFLKSNVPQVIASTTGRIMAHNEIFLRATRLHRSQVERLTIFSLVQPGMLSNLFELVAASLREDDQQDGRRDPNTAIPLKDYSTMTLPCVPFHQNRPTLYMTITLMTDEDVKKRCFHCVFTDCAPGAKGSVGSVTPQLLATLFQPIGSSSGKSKTQSSLQDEGSQLDTTKSKSSSGGTTITSHSDDKQPQMLVETTMSPPAQG